MPWVTAASLACASAAITTANDTKLIWPGPGTATTAVAN
jgi:hypothetical protein